MVTIEEQFANDWALLQRQVESLLSGLRQVHLLPSLTQKTLDHVRDHHSEIVDKYLPYFTEKGRTDILQTFEALDEVVASVERTVNEVLDQWKREDDG